jgi:hypothetical protein
MAHGVDISLAETDLVYACRYVCLWPGAVILCRDPKLNSV